MQDYQYVLSHLQSVSNLLVQSLKITFTAGQDGLTFTGRDFIMLNLVSNSLTR